MAITDVPDVLGHLSLSGIGVERLAEPEMPGGRDAHQAFPRPERIARAGTPSLLSV